MLAHGLRHAWLQPRATAGLRAAHNPICTCQELPMQPVLAVGHGHSHPLNSRPLATEVTLEWSRRNTSALQAAAGIGAQAADVAQRLESIALTSGSMAEDVNKDHSNFGNVPAQQLPQSSHQGRTQLNDVPRRLRQLPIGAFQHLPQVQVASEQLTTALRKAQRVGASKTIRNEAAKARNRSARRMDAAMKAMSVPLTGYIKGFPQVARLHPFERALLDLTVGEQEYTTTLNRVDSLRKRIIELGKQFAARSARAPTKKEAFVTADDGFEALEALFQKHSSAIDDLLGIARHLRRLPLVDPFLPTVALVGAPNVGKSSLVALLSSGTPEVCDYPFTTRSIKMGHFFVSGHRHQVTDTPGLLRRPEDERNKMERLTLAALAHLPTAAVFVMDLTGECGTSVPDQWAIRQHLRERFPSKLWLDVLSKADLLQDEFDAAAELSASQRPRLRDHVPQPAPQLPIASSPSSPAASATAAIPTGAHDTSAASVSGDTCADAGVADVNVSSAEAGKAVQQAVRQAGRGSNGRVYRWGDGSGSADVDRCQLADGIGAIDAVQVAAALPHAVRASATSNEGIEDLKAAVVQLLSEKAFVNQLATGQGPSEDELRADDVAPRGNARILDRGMLAAAV